MTGQDVTLILAVIGNSILLWLAPTLSRRGVFFGVTVRPDFRDTDFAHACVRRYRTVVVTGAIVALAAIAALSPRTRVLALLAHIAVVLGTWTLTRRLVTPYAEPFAAVRSAVITPRATSVPGGALLLAGPFIIVSIAALFVYANWSSIPDHFPSMQRGSAGRLTTKSARTVFGPFVFTAALLVAFTLQTLFMVKRTRQIAAAGPSFDAEASYLMAIGPSWFATQRVLGAGDASAASHAVWLAATLILAVAVAVWMVRVGQGGQRQVPAAAARSGDATPDAAWKAGLLYFNPADPAVFVETRMGVGWSLNFANIWSWVFLAFALAVPMLVLRVMR
jgi:uncharacterized membrane protein